MKKLYEVLKNCELFNNINYRDLELMLSCFKAKSKKYKKNEIIFAEGEPAKCIGIVLSGKAQIVRVDFYGNRSIVADIEPSQIFGESFAFADIKSLPIDVIATEETEVLLIDAFRITQPCTNLCEFHNQIIFNLLYVVSKKNLLFHQKIEITSKRRTREKLMTYLLMQAKQRNSNSFTVPFDRQELADYLEVDRSGLSSEISKMCNDGIIDCKRSTFTLLN